MRQIHDALARHIQREEGEIFPRIARAWSRDRLEQAGAEMSDMQAGKTARPWGAAAAAPGQDGRTSGRARRGWTRESTRPPMTETSSSGSTGFSTNTSKPASTARARSCTRT